MKKQVFLHGLKLLATVKMRYTIDFAQQRFDQFNKQIFNSSLPCPTFCLANVRSYMAQMHRTCTGRLFNKKTVYTMKLNVRYDLEERCAEDIIIHEMIHLFLWVKNMKDTSAHGPIFRETMYRINKAYGRNITISTHHTEELPQNKQMGTKIIAVCRMTDGQTAITIPPATRIKYFAYALKQSKQVAEVNWYYTEDSFFAKYPHPRNVKVYFIDQEILKQHIKEEDKIKSLSER